MTTKARIAKLEKRKPKKQMTWREFIELQEGERLPEDVQTAWDDFIAEKLAEKDNQKSILHD
jgi:hypothetical protein